MWCDGMFCPVNYVDNNSLEFVLSVFLKEFLMLDEVKKHCEALPPTEKTDACVEVQDLICFWDQVR